MSKLALVVTIEVKPGQVAAVLEAAKAHAARSLSSEPGTLQFDVLVPVNEDDKIMLYEAYVDEAAYEVHHGDGRTSRTTMQELYPGYAETHNIDYHSFQSVQRQFRVRPDGWGARHQRAR